MKLSVCFESIINQLAVFKKGLKLMFVVELEMRPHQMGPVFSK